MPGSEDELSFTIKTTDQASAPVHKVDEAIKDVSSSAKSASPHLDKAAKSTKDLGDNSKSASSHVGGMGSALGDVGKIAGGFVLAKGITEAPGFFIDAAKGAAEDQAATERLNTAVRNLGGNFDEHIGKVNDAIDAGQKLAYGDDDVRDSFQTLLAATGDVDEALTRQKAAMDLARGANIPLATATKMLGKLNADNVEVFKKMGITLGENATEADALALVQQKFGGQAATYAKTAAGQWEQFNIRMGEVKETIGYAVLPVMMKVGEILLNNVLPAVEKFAAAIGPAFATFGTFIQETVLPPLQTLAEWFTGNQEAMIGAAVAISVALVAAFTAWAISAGAAAIATIAAAAPVIAVVAAIALLAAGIALLILKWDDITAKYPIVGAASDAIKQKFQSFVDFVSANFVPAVQMIADKTEEYVGKAIAYVVDNWDKIKEPFESFGTFVTDVYIPLMVKIFETEKDIVEKCIAFVVDHWDEIKNYIEPALVALIAIVKLNFKQIETGIEASLAIISGLIDVFVGVFTGDWDKVMEGGKKIIEAAWTAISTSFTNGFAALDTLTNGALSTVAGYFTSFYNGAVQPIQWLIDRIYQLIHAIQSIPSPGSVVGAITGALPSLPGRAAGGPVSAGQAYIVGEKRAEVFVPNVSGRIIPQVGGSGIGGAGGISSVINVNGPINVSSEAQAKKFFGDMEHSLLDRLRQLGQVA